MQPILKAEVLNLLRQKKRLKLHLPLVQQAALVIKTELSKTRK
jgi:hypothetical protein